MHNVRLFSSYFESTRGALHLFSPRFYLTYLNMHGRWWKEFLAKSKMTFVRDRIVETYFLDEWGMLSSSILSFPNYTNKDHIFYYNNWWYVWHIWYHRRVHEICWSNWQVTMIFQNHVTCFFILKILHALTIKYILDGMSFIYIHIYEKKETKIFPVSQS